MDDSQKALLLLIGLWISGDYWSAPAFISSSPQWPTYAWFPRWPSGMFGWSVAATLAKICLVSKNPPAVIMALFSQHMTTTHGPKEFPENSAQRLCSLFPEFHVWLIAFFFFLVTLVKAASAWVEVMLLQHGLEASHYFFFNSVC